MDNENQDGTVLSMEMTMYGVRHRVDLPDTDIDLDSILESFYSQLTGLGFLDVTVCHAMKRFVDGKISSFTDFEKTYNEIDEDKGV